MMAAPRRALRSRLRDLGALAAFAAVLLSGTVPLPVSALFALAWVLSMLGLRPLAGHRVWSVVVLLITAVVLFGSAFRGVMDLVVAAVSFAALVAGHRMLSEPTPGTDQQVLLASLLLMAGAAALSGEMWFAACLLLFGVFACLTLGLAVLEGPGDRDEELPLGPVLGQMSVGVAFALVGALAFFILFPRLSWNVAARRTPPGIFGGNAGMSDRVRLGGGGNIKTSARVVARVTLLPDPKSEQLDQYWVGRHFDTFDGREWKGNGVPDAPRRRVQVGESGPTHVTQQIELLPSYDARTLIALEVPVLFDGATALSTTGSAQTALVRVADEEVHFASNANAFAYTAYSRSPTAPPGPVEASVSQRYLDLPEHLDPRVAELASRVIGNVTDPARIATLLETHLRTEYQYTLELAGEVDDPLADFLFNRRAGHCEHFATALVVMLRTHGVPARVAAGFYGGERVGDHYTIRAGDAHAWAQAFLPGRGWTTFDATPDAGRRSQPTALLATLTSLYERLEELWRARVVDYSFYDQITFARNLVRPPSTAESATAGRLESISRKTWLLLGLGAVALFLVWRLLRTPRTKSRPHPAAAFLDEIELRLERAHIPRQPGEGIEETWHRLEIAHHPLAPPLADAGRRYLLARFGGKPLTRPERAALLAGLDEGRSGRGGEESMR